MEIEYIFQTGKREVWNRGEEWEGGVKSIQRKGRKKQISKKRQIAQNKLVKRNENVSNYSEKE